MKMYLIIHIVCIIMVLLSIRYQYINVELPYRETLSTYQRKNRENDEDYIVLVILGVVFAPLCVLLYLIEKLLKQCIDPILYNIYKKNKNEK